jgi:hypothetical protein
MTNVFRFLATCTIISAFASIASGQVYTSIDFPGAIATTLNGGPNPEGTNIGSYTDTSGVTHGFVLKDGVFTTIDPPGSASTTPNWISPQGAIVGGYNDASGVPHGFILDGGQYTWSGSRISVPRDDYPCKNRRLPQTGSQCWRCCWMRLADRKL